MTDENLYLTEVIIMSNYLTVFDLLLAYKGTNVALIELSWNDISGYADRRLTYAGSIRTVPKKYYDYYVMSFTSGSKQINIEIIEP